MKNYVHLQFILSLGVAALDAIMPSTGFAVAHFNNSDDDCENWGDPIED